MTRAEKSTKKLARRLSPAYPESSFKMAKGLAGNPLKYRDLRCRQIESRKIFITAGERFSVNPRQEKNSNWNFFLPTPRPVAREARYRPHPATRGKFPSHLPIFSLI